MIKVDKSKVWGDVWFLTGKAVTDRSKPVSIWDYDKRLIVEASTEDMKQLRDELLRHFPLENVAEQISESPYYVLYRRDHIGEGGNEWHVFDDKQEAIGAAAKESVIINEQVPVFRRVALVRTDVKT